MPHIITYGLSAHPEGDGESEETWFFEGTHVEDVSESQDGPDFWNVTFTYHGTRWVAGFEGGPGMPYFTEES